MKRFVKGDNVLIRLFAYKDDYIYVIEMDVPAYIIVIQLDHQLNRLNKLSIPYVVYRYTDGEGWLPLYRFAYEWRKLDQYIGMKPMKYYDIKGETSCETKLFEILRL